MEEKIKNFERELLELTKKHIRLINKDFKKRAREEEEEEEEPTPAAAAAVADFTCAGHVWEEPPTSCPGGEKSHIKAGTQIEVDGKKKNVTICRSCYLSRQKLRRAAKKAKNVD